MEEGQGVVVGKNTFKMPVNRNLLSTTTPNPSSIRRGEIQENPPCHLPHSPKRNGAT